MNNETHTVDSYVFHRAQFQVPLTVACPFCKQPRGWDCRSTGNYTVGFHRPRIQATAHLDETERYEAVRVLLDERAATRKQVEEVLSRPLTPEQVATRAAIAEAQKALNKEFRIKERAMYARCRDPWIHNEQCYCREGRPYVAPAPKPRAVREVTDLAAVRARKAGTR